MSMGDSLIRIVRADGLLWIGTMEGAALKSPRIVVGRPDGAMMLVEAAGKPKEINIPETAVRWEPTDEEFIKAYRENVSGLVMAKTMPKGNLVAMPGGRQ